MAKGATSVGSRIREARENRQMTQQEVAKLLGLSRAAIAQWESDTTSPSIHTAAEVSKLLEVSPQWLAFGISTAPKIEYRKPEGCLEIKEVMFGEKPTDMQEGRTWNVPEDYVRAELNANTHSQLFIWRVESPNMAPLYEYGDKVIVDLAAKRPTPSGTFLIWDGIGPRLARVSSTAGNETYEVAADKLQIIGRVRGLLKHV